jgi:hypothetical protein
VGETFSTVVVHDLGTETTAVKKQVRREGRKALL